MIPYNLKIRVQEGESIEKGTRLTEGNIYPADILNILGTQAVQNYIINEVQKVYRLQGVDINDKHIEVIVRQMLKKVRIDESGDTDFLPGTLVDVLDFEDSNEDNIVKMQQEDNPFNNLMKLFKPNINYIL